jgi:glycosyltransferase involved in cell wall biosynthesis
MHCTNTFPLMSPSVYQAARAEGVPVVQSLRNYRLLCPGALFLRDGKVCEDCLGKAFAWPGVRHGCYRQSRAASAVVAGMTAVHRLIGTWHRGVDVYFTPSEFARQKHIEGGLPADRILVKPNFIDPDPGPGTGRGGFALFVGRLSPEKGVDTLLRAWERLGPKYPLKIVGDGPLAESVRAHAATRGHLDWSGHLDHDAVLDLVGEAACLLVPSLWYETFGRTIIEAYARGTPVIASRLGAMSELVDDGRTGLLVEPGNPDALAEAVRTVTADPLRREGMRQASRREYQEKYTGERNHTLLTEIYTAAVRRRGRRQRRADVPPAFASPMPPRPRGAADTRTPLTLL